MEITTNLAPNSRRFAAYFIDSLIILTFVMAFSYVFLGFDKTLFNYLHRKGDTLPREAFLKQRNWIREITFLIWIMYCAVMEMSAKQGTIGKQLMGIKVVNQLGNPLSLKQSIARNFAKVLSYKALFLGFVWIFIDKKKQGWHDKLSKTYVVNKGFMPQIEEEVEESVA